MLLLVTNIENPQRLLKKIFMNRIGKASRQKSSQSERSGYTENGLKGKLHGMLCHASVPKNLQKMSKCKVKVCLIMVESIWFETPVV